jgi:hypothetical protein
MCKAFSKLSATGTLARLAQSGGRANDHQYTCGL